jgi:hypothetical protein
VFGCLEIQRQHFLTIPEKKQVHSKAKSSFPPTEKERKKR